MADWASEGGHWYDATTGEPRYTVIGKSTGRERPSTIRDAREYGWVPSVTTIISQAAKFQLERWKAEQLLLAGLTLPRNEGEAEADWIKRVWDDSKQQASKAAERGTVIHGAIEAHYAERAYDGRLTPWVDSVAGLIEQEFGVQEWRSEKSFASPLGYGGKVDLHSDTVLIDFKGKEGDKRKWQVYDEHTMQLAAYARGLDLAQRTEDGRTLPICGIVFFDRNDPYAEFHEVKSPELERGWRKFAALLDYWKASNL